jgi:coenzyme PQQ synthesis protein D (PqqD)
MVENETRYLQAEGLEVTHMPDGWVVYQQQTDRVHFLNPAAALVFELCNGRHTRTEMATILSAAYQLQSPAATEIENCLANLVAEGLVSPCSSSPSAR